jgi:hypothetical protein
MAATPTQAWGRPNVVVAWWMIGVGTAAGAVMGVWSFGGPVPAPAGFVRYDDLPRRLARLAHIAAVALPALNLLYVSWMQRSALGRRARRLGCRALLFGTLTLPVLLALTAFWGPALYALPAPVLALVGSFFLLAAGMHGAEREAEESGP